MPLRPRLYSEEDLSMKKAYFGECSPQGRAKKWMGGCWLGGYPYPFPLAARMSAICWRMPLSSWSRLMGSPKGWGKSTGRL